MKTIVVRIESEDNIPVEWIHNAMNTFPPLHRAEVTVTEITLPTKEEKERMVRLSDDANPDNACSLEDKVYSWKKLHAMIEKMETQEAGK